MGGVFAPGTYSFVGDEMISVAGGDFRWMGVVALISHSLEVSPGEILGNSKLFCSRCPRGPLTSKLR